MALRIPPGRAGRMWLVRRLHAAGRGAELLDRKRQALLRERSRVRREAQEAREAWERAAAQAAMWSVRAALLDGSGRLELLARHQRGEASVEVSWSNVMGARLPSVRRTVVPGSPPLSALGGSAAAICLAGACAEATRAAARCAAAERAQVELAGELLRTSRRLRALQERLIPQHEEALAHLDLVLDEAQREQAVRVRWLTQRPDTPPRRRAS